MFIRWRRKQTKKEGAGFHYIRAELVESYRKDGKPQQRCLKYLGSIREASAKDMGYFPPTERFETMWEWHKKNPEWAKLGKEAYLEIRNERENHYRIEQEYKVRLKFWTKVNTSLAALQSEREGFTQEDAEKIKVKLSEKVDRVVWAKKDGETIYL
jgi:hypothetical protein